MFSVLVRDFKWILIHADMLFCSIRLIHLIRWKVLHFGKKARLTPLIIIIIQIEHGRYQINRNRDQTFSALKFFARLVAFIFQKIDGLFKIKSFCGCTAHTFSVWLHRTDICTTAFKTSASKNETDYLVFLRLTSLTLSEPQPFWHVQVFNNRL